MFNDVLDQAIELAKKEERERIIEIIFKEIKRWENRLEATKSNKDSKNYREGGIYALEYIIYAIGLK